MEARNWNVIVVLAMTLVLLLASLGHASERVELRVAVFQGPIADSVRAIKDAFESEYPNISLELSIDPHDPHHDKLFTQISAGLAPDVALLNDYRINAFISRNVLTDVTSYIERDENWNSGVPGYGVLYPELDYMFKADGRRYGIPANIATIVMGYNVDKFNDAGMTSPYDLAQDDGWTWDAFLEIAKKLTKGQGTDKSYGYVTQRRPWHVWVKMWQNGSDMFNADRTKTTINDQAALDAVTFWWHDLYRVHDVAPNPIRTGGAELSENSLFPSGKAAMFEAGVWTRGTFQNVDFEWALAPQPRKVRQVNWAGGGGWAIPVHAKNPNEAWTFINYMLRPEVAMLLLEANNFSPVPAASELAAEVWPGQPQNVQVWVDAIRTSNPPPYIEGNNDEMMRIMARELDLMALGQKSPEAAVDTIARDVDRLLR